MAFWGPKIIDLMDRLGVPFNRTPEGFRDQRRFGGTLFKRTAFAGATTGQQLLYALDEQVRRWESEGLVRKYEGWDFLRPVLDDTGQCCGAIAQNLFTMEIRAFPADALVVASGGCGLIFGRSTMSMVCNGSAASRCFQFGVKYANGEFVQVHPTAIPGADKLRLMSESARGEGGRVWVPRTPQDPRDPRQIPENERNYFLETRYPKYGNLVPRDIATREIFKVCVEEGLSVEKDRLCVYLDLTHLPREMLDLKLGGILEIYEKFQGVDPRDHPMKIFPAVHYSMGGLWVDYERTGDGGLSIGSPSNQQTNLPGLYAIGECDYQYHGANRLGANSLLSCIFSGLIVAPGIHARLSNLKSGTVADRPTSLFEMARRACQSEHDNLLRRPGRGENPYLLHQELGRLMTESATVVRHNEALSQAIDKVEELAGRIEGCSLSDTGQWTNQNVVFTKALRDMLPLARAILHGALARDECRGAHYKPQFALPGIEAENPAEKRRQAQAWCDRFEANNQRWLKTTVATLDADGQPQLAYEPVDTSLIPPRPRLYGLVGAEIIEEVWRERQRQRPSTDAPWVPERSPAVAAGG
jgi:succinate dehydrogenase / fumarate reductase flavoprotein subunit